MFIAGYFMTATAPSASAAELKPKVFSKKDI